MAIAILAGTPVTGTDDGSTASVSASIPPTVPDGSLIIAIHCNDFRDLVNMVAPTVAGPAVTPTLLGSVDGGTNLSHIKVWGWAHPAGATGTARAVTFTETGTHDGDKGASIWAFSGADTSTILDGTLVASSSPSTSQANHVLAAVTVANTASLLIGHLRTSNGAGTAGYTAPGSMTERYDVANFTRFTGASEQLSASGSTGTRTFVPASSVPWVGVLFAILPAAAGGGPAAIPATRRVRPTAPARPRRSRSSAPPIQASAAPPEAGQQHRTRAIPAPRARARIVTPVRAQVNPPFPTNEDVQPRRLRGLLCRRARVVMPPWPQQTPPVNPDWIPPARRPRQVPEILRRNHIWAPPWPALTAPTAPLWVPADRRPRPTPILPRRDRGAAPPAGAAPQPPAGHRPKLVLPTARRDRGTAPPLPAVLWLPGAHRLRLVEPAVRVRRQERLVLASPVVVPNPPIVVLQPHHRWLVLPVLRGARFFGPPLVGAAATECKVHRPFTGVAARASTGTVARPFTGIVEFCTCCT